jgi:4-amino-4-deoxy-L-arabinose transferase-like glycosyltransferase
MRNYLAVFLIGILFFIPFLGDVHLFDWDEINFAECAREMIVTGDYFRPQINFEPFWEKPPLFIWMQVLSMKAFGINAFAARFPNAICGIATLLFLFYIGSKLYNTRMAWLWVMVWLASFLPHFYFKSGIIDPWFNLFIFIGLWLFFLGKCYGTQQCSFFERWKYFVAGGLVCGAAIMTKGPVALLVSGLVIGAWWLARRMNDRALPLQFILFIAASLVLPAIWFTTDIALHGMWFTETFTRYQIRLFFEQDAGHGGFFGYHFIVFLLGCFFASAYATPWLFRLIPAWRDPQIADRKSVFTLWMWILFWVVMVLFSLVQTKIVHYSSLIYFPVTFFAAYSMWTAEKWNMVSKLSKNLMAILGIIMAAILISLPNLGSNTTLLAKIFKDDAFALGNLEADVSWQWYHGLPGVFLCFGIITALMYINQKKVKIAHNIVLGSGILTVASAILLLPSNIEQYSQNAAIRFYQDHAQEDCYIITYHFKSYAHLFYAQKRRPEHPSSDDYLMEHDKPKPVYIIAKVNQIGELKQEADVTELYQKNGFAFFKKRNQKLENGTSTME